MRDRVVYEYVIELKDDFGDIVNLSFYSNLNNLCLNIPDSKDYDFDIALVRSIGNDNEDLKDRSYAYFQDNKLPTHFDNGVKVPQKYLQGE